MMQSTWTKAHLTQACFSLRANILNQYFLTNKSLTIYVLFVNLVYYADNKSHETNFYSARAHMHGSRAREEGSLIRSARNSIHAGIQYLVRSYQAKLLKYIDPSAICFLKQLQGWLPKFIC